MLSLLLIYSDYLSRGRFVAKGKVCGASLSLSAFFF